MKIKGRKEGISLLILSIIISCGYRTTEDDNLVDFVIYNLTAVEVFSLPTDYVLRTENGKPITIDSAFSKPTLVFRFSELQCENCIMTELAIIKSLGCNNHIVGLGSYNNPRQLSIARQKYQIDFPLLFMQLSETDIILPTSLESIGVPYYFVMSKQGLTKQVFIPNKQFPEISKKYLQVITEKLTNLPKQLILFEKISIDIGTVSKNHTDTIKYRFTNYFSHPIIITDVKASCGFIVPQWDKRPISQNESAELTVFFTPDNQGYHSKSIMVFHNQSPDPIKLLFKANVE
jgi:hypothetical protein